MNYKLLDHTADLKVEIFGRDLPELFASAAFMLFDVMVDLERVKEVQSEEVKIASDDLSELFLDWLRELLFLFSTRGLVIKRVRIKRLDELALALEATVYGEPYEPNRHGLKIEIKTPTYHQFAIRKKEDGGWQATVIFDV
ncbi:MAG: archease [candidate division WOR-3 bacterium]